MPAEGGPEIPTSVRRAFPESSAGLQRYADLLVDVGIPRGLIDPRERNRLWDRHLANCLALAPLVPDGATLLDVGSGAGLPGLPVALVRPDLRVTLLEPLLRRATFLEEAVAELQLGDRVRVVRARAEEVRDSFAVVTARAVAPLDRLLRWTAPLIAASGELLALKGDRAATELGEASAQLRRLRCRGEIVSVPDVLTGAPVTVVRVRRS